MKDRNASVRVASMAASIWRTWGRLQHLYKQGQYYELYLQMTEQIQMVPDNNSVKSAYALTACLQGCSVYPSSCNKNSAPGSAKNPENRLSQTLSRSRNLPICLGLSRVVEKKKMCQTMRSTVSYMWWIQSRDFSVKTAGLTPKWLSHFSALATAAFG